MSYEGMENVKFKYKFGRGANGKRDYDIGLLVWRSLCWVYDHNGNFPVTVEEVSDWGREYAIVFGSYNIFDRLEQVRSWLLKLVEADLATKERVGGIERFSPIYFEE